MCECVSECVNVCAARIIEKGVLCVCQTNEEEKTRNRKRKNVFLVFF